MPEKIFIGVAWPYANGSLHLGQIAGAYLPPDIFARYHRLKGNRVLMVSGSDQHGTPITVRAQEEGTTPAAVASRFHLEFVESWRQLGIGFDLYTTTGTENHAAVTQDMFLRLHEKGDIYLDKMRLPYCTVEQRFLLDRYVEGICPICGFAGARGDQCDNCGNPLDPEELIDAHCKFDHSIPEVRESEHFFLRLSAYNDKLKAWLSRGQGALAAQRAQLLAWRSRTGAARPRHNAGYRVGDKDTRSPATIRSASTSGSRTSSATCRRRRSGRTSAASRTPGAISGRTPPARATTSSARTTSGSTR